MESSGGAEYLDHQFGRTLIWTAIDAPIRQMITFWIGGLELDYARQILKDSTSRCQGNAKIFKSDRKLAAFVGLVSRQSGTGGRVKLLGISKRGDVYRPTSSSVCIGPTFAVSDE